MPSTFSQMPRRRRRAVHLTARDLRVLEDLVVRRVETVDFIHETHFAGLSRKRALNRLGDLIAAGYLKRMSIELPGEELPQSVYWLTSRGQTALQLRSLAGEWFRERPWKLELAPAAIPHQIVTNRVADWLGATVLPEHLVPLPPRTRSDNRPRQRPDAVYRAAQASEGGTDVVYVEVDLGHYNRKRILEKVRAAITEPRVRMLLIACPVESRQNQLIETIRDHFGESIWDRVDVMTFADPGRQGTGLSPSRRDPAPDPSEPQRTRLRTPPMNPPAAITLHEPLLTAADVASLLGVPRSTIYEYARRQVDPLPSVEIGRHRRFARSDLEHWLTSHRSG